MTAATFRAHCAKGHDRIDFQGEDGAKAFEAHMKGEHGHRSIYPGGPTYQGDTKAPGWAGGEIEKPYAWKAPRPLTPAQFAKRMESYATKGENLGMIWNPDVKRWHALIAAPLSSWLLDPLAS